MFNVVRRIIIVITIFAFFMLIAPLPQFCLSKEKQNKTEQSNSVSTINMHTNVVIHELFPNTHWSHLKPCGTLFHEQSEFQKALQCVNTKVWSDKPLVNLVIPRCFIVSNDSPDVRTDKTKFVNFIPVPGGAIVGVYQPKTQTVFVVSNEDAAIIYRHELQHHFQHGYYPSSLGAGHTGPIWEKCEAAQYTPSARARAIHAARG